MVCVLNLIWCPFFWLELNKNFIGHIGSPACRQANDNDWFKYMDLLFYLKQSSWIIELEHALERFSIRTYLDWFDQHHLIDVIMDPEFPEIFLNYLKDKVIQSNPCS